MKNRAAVISRFTVCQGRPDLLENKRVTQDWCRLMSSREIQREKGKKSAAARAGKQNSIDEPLFNNGSATGEQGIEIVKEIVKDKEKEKEEEENGAGLLVPSSQPGTEEGTDTDMASSAKRFADRLVRVWHEVHGESAIVRTSEFSKKEFEFLVTNHDQNML